MEKQYMPFENNSKKIIYIFLTNQYLPKPGATGLCVHKIAKELAKDKDTVFTICYGASIGNKDEITDNVHIIRIKEPFYLMQHNNKLISRIAKITSRIVKLLHLKRYPLRSILLSRKYINEANNIIHRYSGCKKCIVASYTPLEAVYAGMLLKKKYDNQIKAVFYSTDTLSNEQGTDAILSAERRRILGLRWEKRIFQTYDNSIIMQCHEDYYHSSVFKEYQNKILTSNFPLLENNTSIEYKKKQGSISFVYAGTLYKNLRNPSFTCRVLMTLCSDFKEGLKIVFLGSGDCDDILKQAEIETNKQICYLGLQPYEVANKYINNSDVLLSIGNHESQMMPSKIFEYIATGKPIIHFYSYCQDPCISPLLKYGNALLINQQSVSVNEAKKMISDFIKEIKYIDYPDIITKFIDSTPKYTTDLIQGLME